MFKFIKQKFIALLNFIVSLATKCISLNDEPCLFRPALIDLNPPLPPPPPQNFFINHL